MKDEGKAQEQSVFWMCRLEKLVFPLARGACENAVVPVEPMCLSVKPFFTVSNVLV